MSRDRVTWVGDQHRLITRQEALAVGYTPAAIKWELSRHGGWTYVLRGVYALQTGPLTRDQRWAAALRLGGPEAVLGGPTAAVAHGMRAAAPTDRVHLLLPHHVRRVSSGFVAVRRTQSMPESVTVDGWRSAPIERAVIDACRTMDQLSDVRALVAEAVQRRRTTVTSLARELDRGAARGSGLTRIALDEVGAGVRSPAEAESRRLVLRSPLLRAMQWNVNLFTTGGLWLACVDGWLAEAGLVFEVDSKRWHLSPAAWEATQMRHALLTSYGLLVVHAAPQRMHTAGATVIAELERSFLAGRARGGAPQVTDIPPAGWRGVA